MTILHSKPKRTGDRLSRLSRPAKKEKEFSKKGRFRSPFRLSDERSDVAGREERFVHLHDVRWGVWEERGKKDRQKYGQGFAKVV